jgi:sugar phosphate isomerase/epimerase
MSPLSLAHFTVIDADPLALIDVAADAGFDGVGLRLVAPPGAAPIVPVVGDAALQRAIRERLRARAVALLDVEAIWITPETRVTDLAPVLEVAAALGARSVIVSGNDPDDSRLVDNLGHLCEAAARCGLRVMLEFLPYTQVRTLGDAHALLTQVKPADAGILVDALHLSRSGGSPSDLARYDPGLFSLVHLCDAPATIPAPAALRDEARGGRLLPGEGGLPLMALLQAVPPDVVTAVEAPSAAAAGLPPAARAKAAFAASRSLLARLGR